MSDNPQSRASLEQSIAALEAQRAVLGDAIEPALEALRAQLVAIDAKERAEDQRKQVTIVFADVQGFTSMSKTMDPEDVASVMNRLWAGVDEAIVARGGTIDKHIGDAVMAIFGAPVAHEDDPERAILAALDMQAAVASAQDDADTKVLQMRVGINTGLAMLGTVGSTDEYTAIGHTVNLASRLETAAPPGGILISYETMKHVRGLFDIEAIAPLDVKGVDEPVAAFRVKRAKPRTFRVATREVAGVETKTVGRDAEIAQLVGHVPGPGAPSDVNLVTLYGEPGVGKSRLVYELFNHLEAQPHPVWLFRGRSVESTRDSPYALMRNIVFDRMLIAAGDSADVAKAKLTKGLSGFAGDEGEAMAPYIGHLIGFDYQDHPSIRGLLTEPKLIRERAFAAFSKLLHLGRDGRLVVMLVEDIHWADTDSLELLEHLGRTCDDIPLLIVCTARPDFVDLHPDWDEGPNHGHIMLLPLGADAAEALLDNVLQRLGDIPDELRHLISRRSEGNPFFLEELVKMLIDDGVIDTRGPEWRVDVARLSGKQIPGTLTGVLQARVDSLTRPERRALQRASVVGRVFWEDAVDHLALAIAPDEEAERLAAVANALEHRELAYERHGSAFASTREFIFKHAILHDVVYESVVKRIRLPYHEAAAHWLIGAAGDRTAEFAAEIADHFDRAGESAAAVEWLVRAGDRAKQTYSPEAAGRAYARALEIAERSPAAELPEHKIAALEGLGDVLTTQGRYDEAIETFEQMRQEAVSQRNHLAEAHAEHGLATAQTYRGDFREALASAERSAASAKVGGGRLEEVRALWLQGWSRLRLGMMDGIGEFAGEILETSRQVGDAPQLARSLNLAGVVAYASGRWDDATERFDEAASMFEQMGNPLEAMPLLNNIGVIADVRGDYESAQKRYAEAIDMARETENRDAEMVYMSNYGGTEVALGAPAEAEATLRAVIEMAEGSLGVLPDTYAFLAMALLAQDRPGEAREAAAESLRLATASEAPDYMASAWRALGSIASRHGEIEVEGEACDAATCFERSLTAAESIDSAYERARTLASWALHDAAQGRGAEAAGHWEEARVLFTEVGADREIERIEILLSPPPTTVNGD